MLTAHELADRGDLADKGDMAGRSDITPICCKHCEELTGMQCDLCQDPICGRQSRAFAYTPDGEELARSWQGAGRELFVLIRRLLEPSWELFWSFWSLATLNSGMP